MTSTPAPTIDKLPPAGNEVIAKIMSEHHVGRKRAYTILRQQRTALFSNGGVPDYQRAQVLHAIVRYETKDVPNITDTLHRLGIQIDMHDVTKTLWALQKTRYVHFRERQGRDLYAVKVTDEGRAAYASMASQIDREERGVPGDVARVADQVLADADRKRAEEAAAAKRAEEEAAATLVIEEEPEEPEIPPFVAERVHESLSEAITGAVMADDTIKRPWIKGNLGGWPAIREVRDRAIRVEKLKAAAALLEQAGEDEMALTIMDKTEYSALEEEVVSLLRAWGEL